MSTDVVLIGAGGFGRESLDVINAINAGQEAAPIRLLGVVDDGPDSLALERLASRGIVWLGSVDTWLASAGSESHVIAIGDPSTRATISKKLDGLGRSASAPLVHPSAVIGFGVMFGPGTIVCAGAHISSNVTTGRHTHVNPHTTIGHDVTIDDCVSINPAATVSGNVVIGDETLVGAGAVILQGLQIGKSAIIGASACVTRNVPGGSTVKGVPAR